MCASAPGQSPTAEPARLPSQSRDVAFARAQHLRRGINTSLWFAQSANNYSVQRLRTFTTLDDIVLIHRLGFDHIRLSVDPAPLTLWQQGTPEGLAFMAELDRVLAASTERGLAVVFDVHPEESYKRGLLPVSPGAQQAKADSAGAARSATQGEERFIGLWRALAMHLHGTNPALVFFEIMNESEQPDAAQWQAMQTRVAQTIREAAPDHTIIASGAHWDGLDDLLHLSPLPLGNIIYTFHDYEPFPFTHQGATWTMAEVRPLRGVPYPSSPEAIAALLPQEPTLAAQYWLEQYGLGRWDADRISHTLDFAQQWSRLHGAPVYCGEFGVHKPFAPPADRARWIHNMRVALEARDIGWAMWDYQANFGLVTKQAGKATPDPLIVDALGLNAAPEATAQ